MPQPDGYETLGQLCERLHVSTPTVYLWIRKGMPSLKVGRLRRFKISDVNRWLEEQGQTEHSPEGSQP
jgi:excisionase family DNA binding protein